MKTISRTNQNYPVLVEKSNDGFFLVNCPLFDDCYSEGQSVSEALENIREIIELRLEEGMKPRRTFKGTNTYSVIV